MMDQILKIIEVSGEQVTKVAEDAIGIRFHFRVGSQHTILNGQLQKNWQLLHDKPNLIRFVHNFSWFHLRSVITCVGEDVDESLLAVADDLVDVDVLHIVFALHSAKYMIIIVIINLLNFLYYNFN